MFNNRDRSNSAWEALKRFAEVTNMDNSGEMEHEPEVVMQDLLANLMHWSAFERIDFERFYRNACHHFTEEFKASDLYLSDTLEGSDD